MGKSSILLRLTDDRFSTTEPTLGVEFGSRILTVGEEGKKVKVQCEGLLASIQILEVILIDRSRLGYGGHRKLSKHHEELFPRGRGGFASIRCD